MQKVIRRISLALLLFSMIGLLPAPARAERSTTTPTGHWWFMGASVDDIKARVEQGYRIHDLEIESVSPFRLSAALVKNSGAHAKSWWWYYGVTIDTIVEKLNDHKARVIDLESYVVDGQRRYAVVMVGNTGAQAKSWWWYVNLDSAQAVNDKLTQNQARIIDLDTFVSGGKRYYNVVMIRNSGADASAWWWYYNVSPDFISDKINEHGARIIDLEPHGDNTFTVVLEKNTGKAWWWYYGIQSVDQLKHLTTLNNARVIDIEPYFPSPGQKRYAVVLLQNGDPPKYSIPVTGAAVPQLKAFDDAMVDFMLKRDIPGGTLVVMKDGHVVLERGYGWKDKAETVAMPPNALLRLASVTKPFTQAIVRKLAAEGALSLNDRVFCLPGSPANCHLDIDPWPNPAVFDLRLRNITIQHLLDHKGGWDRDISGDPMFKAIEIADDLNVASPPSKQNIARWVLGKTLDHNPGDQYAYSNFGYMLLGLIIEQETGQDYTAYLRDEIMNPLGVPDSEIGLGATLLNQANPREPYYHAAGKGTSVFPPHAQAEWPYGPWHLEAMEAHGGLIASARAVAEFLDGYWMNGTPRSGNGQSWTFFGSLDGTWTMARQRSDGVNIVALFNQRSDPSGLKYDLIQGILDTAADGIAAWPGQEIPAVRPALKINFADGAPGSFFTLRAAGLEPNEDFRLELYRARTLDEKPIVSVELGSDDQGNFAAILATDGLTAGPYYALLLPAVQRVREARALPALESGADLSALASPIDELADELAVAPGLDQRTGAEVLATVSLELRDDAELRPIEPDVDGPVIQAVPSNHTVYLPLLMR